MLALRHHTNKNKPVNKDKSRAAMSPAGRDPSYALLSATDLASTGTHHGLMQKLGPFLSEVIERVGDQRLIRYQM